MLINFKKVKNYFLLWDVCHEHVHKSGRKSGRREEHKSSKLGGLNISSPFHSIHVHVLFKHLEVNCRDVLLQILSL